MPPAADGRTNAETRSVRTKNRAIACHSRSPNSSRNRHSRVTYGVLPSTHARRSTADCSPGLRPRSRALPDVRRGISEGPRGSVAADRTVPPPAWPSERSPRRIAAPQEEESRMSAALDASRARELAAQLDLDLGRIPICYPCLSFVSMAIDGGDEPKIRGATVQFTPDLWEVRTRRACASCGRTRGAARRQARRAGARGHRPRRRANPDRPRDRASACRAAVHAHARFDRRSLELMIAKC